MSRNGDRMILDREKVVRRQQRDNHEQDEGVSDNAIADSRPSELKARIFKRNFERLRSILESRLSISARLPPV